MFLTLQFPLFDYRYIKTDPNRIARPNWPEPAKHDRIRYFGEIFDRKTPYLGPWDDEKKYCNARSVLNLCGLKDQNYYKLLFNDAANSRILFRRFQSDGKCMAKFEIGLNDEFEYQLAGQKPDAAAVAKAVDEHILKYLLCMVKVKVGSKLEPYTPLIDAGNDLRSAYYWATNKGKKSFDLKEIKNDVESCEPVLLMQLDSSQIDISGIEMEKVDLPGLSDDGIALYCRYIPYKLGHKPYNLKTWVIVTKSNYGTLPLKPYEFDEFNETIRYMRINLLRIHVEVILQKKLVEALTGNNAAYAIKDSATRDRLYFYLHKIWLNLSGIKRNKLPQQQLVQTAFNLDSMYYGSAGLDDQMKILEDYKDWLKNLKVNADNEQVIKYVEENVAGLQQKKHETAGLKTIFISYNHADEIAANTLKQKLEAAKINVILDSASMQAGTSINQFITNSIKASNAIVSLVSTNSLSSGWVCIETVNTLVYKDFFPEQKLIPCALDKQFLENQDFVDDTMKMLEQKITNLKKKIAERNGSTVDLDEKKNRLQFLHDSLPKIVLHLDTTFCIDMAAGKLETNFPLLLEAILN